MDTHLEEGEIRDTPCQEPLDDDWNNIPPLPHDPISIPPPPLEKPEIPPPPPPVQEAIKMTPPLLQEPSQENVEKETQMTHVEEAP